MWQIFYLLLVDNLKKYLSYICFSLFQLIVISRLLIPNILSTTLWPLTNTDPNTSVNSSFNNVWNNFSLFLCFIPFPGRQVWHQQLQNALKHRTIYTAFVHWHLCLIWQIWIKHFKRTSIKTLSHKFYLPCCVSLFCKFSKTSL